MNIMKQLQKRVDELDTAYAFHCDEANRVWGELLQAKDELMKLHMAAIDGSQYTKKLERLKTILNDCRYVRFAFHKQEHPYHDDDHEAMEDPLDWKISEYDMLGMETWIDVVFYYHNEALRTFVKRWMQDNTCGREADEEEFTR
jgi:hypothetical protein